MRRHQDNHHAPPGSGTLTGQPPSPSAGGLGSLPSRSSSALSNAGLFASELNGGSPELVMPSVGSSSYPQPGSNSSTTSSSSGHHFASGGNQTADSQQFTGWDSVSNVVQLDSCIQYAPSASSSGYLTTCPAEDGQSVAWPSAPAESVSPKTGKKPTTGAAGLKAGQNNKVNAGTSKIPAAMPANVKSSKKSSSKVKVQHIQNGKATSNGSNKRMATDSGVGANNDGLTTQQLELIQEIMRQTQEQHRLMQEEQQQHIQHSKPAQTSSHSSSGPATAKPKKTNSKVKWTAPAAPSAAAASSSAVTNDPAASSTAATNSADGTAAANVSGRPVECNVCQRRFKNTPALNGHMRLHGGFLKKDAECSGSSGSGNGSGGGSGSASGAGSGKKPGESKKDPNTPPLLTASVSVRALIEEKIIQRRNNMAANNQSITTSSSSSSTLTTTTATVSSAVAAVQEQPHALPIQPANPPEASVMMMDVLDEEQRDAINQVSQPLIPKLEPEGYFEGMRSTNYNPFDPMNGIFYLLRHNRITVGSKPSQPAQSPGGWYGRQRSGQ